ncbi:restriction endonuclease [Dongshaea marina]|uniref:restriction endonuclease n=1 Tax=Dongshaea marina TaxID=2047966 RepID=UPI000D3E30BE|nr:restriction endonuclease [Dongshaea marina]
MPEYLTDPFLWGIGVVLLILFWRLRRPLTPHARNIKDSKRLYRRLCRQPQGAGKLNRLKQIDPYLFEELLLTAFEKKGYRIERNSKYAGDGGIDGKLFLGRKRYYIQAKRYRNYIRSEHVSEFISLCERDRVQGYFVHTGKTPDSVKKLFAQQKRVELISGPRLLSLFRR